MIPIDDSHAITTAKKKLNFGILVSVDNVYGLFDAGSLGTKNMVSPLK